MDEVDNFLAHYGVKGMKWGKRQSSTGEPKPKMSREKKIAIAVGVGTAVAVGAAITLSILDKKVNDGGGFAFGDLPVQTLTTNKTMMAGKANLIFNAAAMAATPAPPPRKSIPEKAKEAAFNKVKSTAINKAQKMSYDDFKAMIDTTPKVRTGLIDKTRGAVKDKAKEIVINKVRDKAVAKADSFSKARSK